MSVWPSFSGAHPTLAGSEGTLVSITVHVEPRHLERLLDALAQLDFPINPQIYHEAAETYVQRDGTEETVPTTLVEFPAYERRLPEVRTALATNGLPPDAVHVTDMLDEIRSEDVVEPAPAGAPYIRRVYRKHAGVLAAGAWRA